MTIKPVEKISTPKYPDKYNEEMHKILTTAKPNRWISTPMVSGLLAATIALSLSGCIPRYIPEYITGGDTTMMPDGTMTPEVTTTCLPTTSPLPTETPDIFDNVIMGDIAMVTPDAPYASLIPLFEYGEGTGAIGCVSIAAPVFLSEEEAFAVISAAFAEADLILHHSDEVLENINIPVTDIYNWEEKTDRYATTRGNLKTDGLLEAHNLPVAFISTTDVQDWHEDTEMMSSVSSYNVKKTAQTLAETNPGIVVFYDPLASYDYDKLMTVEKEDGESDEEYYARYDAIRKEEAQTVREESERLLRQQAEAFIEWLKGW